MPSERYYRQQAMALLSWARDASGAITDLNPLLTDFNDQQMRDR